MIIEWALAVTLAAAPSGAQWLGPKPPAVVQRIVTVAPSLTETIVALGATERLVGVSRFDEQAEVAQLPRVGGFNDPGVETIVALKPDLVVVQKSPGNQKPIEQLAALGIPVLALPLTSVNDVLEAMTELGRVLQLEENAVAMVTRFQTVRGRIREAAKARKHAPTVLLVYGFAPLVVAGPGSFAHELLLDCGARNAAEKAPTPYPTYPLERAVKLTPDIIIDAADTSTGRDEVKRLAPLKRARWVTLTSKDLLHPGPTLAHGLEGLNTLLFPTSSDAGL